MKLKYLLSWMLLVSLFSCEDESRLTPRSEDLSSISRFEFPQGDNAWDHDLEEIANTFRTIPIYTAFDSLDLNQLWSGAYTISRFGETLDEEYAAFYTDFFKNHVFAFLKPELVVGVLPNYIYLVDDLRQKGAFTSGFAPLACFWTGLDFWAFSLRAKEENLAIIQYPNGLIINLYTPYDLPKTSWEYKTRRTVILQNIVAKIVEKGNVEIPVEFEAGGDFNYTTSINTTNVNAENYYLKFGHPGVISPAAYNITKPNNNTKMDVKSNFINYLKLGLRYTRDSVLIQYPQDKYPLIIKYYDITVKYMQSKYDWDITKMAEWPAIKED